MREGPIFPCMSPNPKDIENLATELGVSIPDHPLELEWSAMNSQAKGVVSLSERLLLNEQATKELANSYVPSFLL